MTKANRHVVDQLADVRDQLKAAGEREKELKAQVEKMLARKDSVRGDEFVAFPVPSHRKGGLDEVAMVADGINVEKYRKPGIDILSIRLTARKHPKVPMKAAA